MMTEQPPHEPEQGADPLGFWKDVAAIPDKYQKKFDRGTYKGTSWDPTWAKKRCTELWGAYGQAWGLRDLRVEQVPGEKGETVGLLLFATFWCPLTEYPIMSDIAYKPHNEALKKLQTDCLKKALTYLGFAADIYLGEFEDDPHIQASTDPRPPKELAEAAVKAIGEAKTPEEIAKVIKYAREQLKPGFHLNKVIEAYNARTREINTGTSAADSVKQMEERL